MRRGGDGDRLGTRERRGETGLLNEVRLIPRRLVNALGLKNNEVPSLVMLPRIVPALEIGQGGWVQHEVVFSTVTLTVAVSNAVLLPTDLGFTHRAIALEFMNVGGGAVDTVVQMIKIPGAASAELVRVPTTSGSNHAGNETLIGPVSMMDSFNLQAFTDPNLIAGTVVIRLLTLRVPTGNALPF